ncbi:hypothetical protein FHS96_000284 [Sphingomonas zeicaulis]|uniref:hypothetical protein n=1 Tax=Sphingomonas zeicaulis TaxID=1632740 RepID=UPI003D1ACAD3
MIPSDLTREEEAGLRAVLQSLGLRTDGDIETVVAAALPELFGRYWPIARRILDAIIGIPMIPQGVQEWLTGVTRFLDMMSKLIRRGSTH